MALLAQVSRDADFSLVKMDVLFGTEIPCYGDTVEIPQHLNDTGILNGPHIEKQHQCGQQDGSHT